MSLWLEEGDSVYRSSDRGQAPVHDDFRLENVLLGDCGTVQAVLDWEMGDVSEDQRIVLGDIESRFENAALLLERADFLSGRRM